MKKNKMMRLASVLLVAVILTTCAISGTFAKYVTSDNGFDNARVAKFGVGITANGSTFATEYVTDDTNVVGTIAKSVISSDADKLVAPGTKGDMVNMTLSGTPEVAVKVTYDATVTLNDKWTDGTDFYFPLNIKVNGTLVNLSSATDAAGVQTAIENAIESYSKNYAPNTDLGTVGADSLAISWEWAFEGNDDAKDTYLGDQAAAGNAATISLAVTTTVTQID